MVEVCGGRCTRCSGFFFYNFAFLISRVRLRTVTGSRKFGMLDDLNARVENT